MRQHATSGTAIIMPMLSRRHDNIHFVLSYPTHDKFATRTAKVRSMGICNTTLIQTPTETKWLPLPAHLTLNAHASRSSPCRSSESDATTMMIFIWRERQGSGYGTFIACLEVYLDQGCCVRHRDCDIRQLIGFPGWGAGARGGWQVDIQTTLYDIQ